MFATFGGFRRRVAVLLVLSLVASVLVAAAPVSAADDPEPSFGASFDACVGVEGSGFTDVPAGHTNAGDIDCIAYYTITKGTSATTYSPLSAVTREQMALFLIRLANRVEITVPPASATDFTDVGDLSTESQDAISQLAQLEITQGTSDTTFSPADGVRRDHMALFVQRLMNIMDSITDDDGHTPSDVVDNDDKAEIGSPFTDLGLVTKSAYDAITELYELGVASGISGTAYGPSSLITRASMAGFMAAVLDHSNARPAGLSIQANKTSGWGPIADVTVIVSYRDESFMPVADQTVDLFHSETSLDRFGTCEDIADMLIDGDCTWTANDDRTDENGNIILDASASEGATNVFYAWIGSEDDEPFDRDDSEYVTASIASKYDEAAVKVDNGISDKALKTKIGGSDFGWNVDLSSINEIVITLQLQDDNGDNVDNVARSGIKLKVNPILGSDDKTVVEIVTDENGAATYTVTGPANTSANNDQRLDIIEFTYQGSEKGIEVDDVKIAWIETPKTTKQVFSDADSYTVVSGSGRATVNVALTYYDQYGHTFRQAPGQRAAFYTGNSSPPDDIEAVSFAGVAKGSYTLTDQKAGGSIKVEFVVDPKETDEEYGPPRADIVLPAGLDAKPKEQTVQVVTKAVPTDRDLYTVFALYADENKFSTATSDKKSALLLFSYDADDTFINAGSEITMAKFEELLDAKEATKAVDVITYSDTGGKSIFEVQ